MSLIKAANPVFLREMREAMRNEAKTDPWRIKLLMVLLLAGAVLYTATALGYYHLNAPVIAFYVLALVEAAYVTRAVDVTTIVAREKQQNTFESLMLTPLSPGRYMRGHLMHQLVLTLRRITAMLPLFAAVYVLGGFALREFLIYQWLLLVYVVAFNSLAMSFANTQSAQSEAAQSGLAGWAKSRRAANANRLDPLAFLVIMIFPVFMGLNATTGGTLLQVLFNPGASLPSPTWDLLRALGLFHPFIALLIYGDAMIFGRPVPLWIVCTFFWALIAQACYFTFVHQVMIRHFRPDRGYRLGRWLLLSGILLLIAAFGWRMSTWAAVAVFCLSALSAVQTFTNPMSVPLRTPERWELLPRFGILVHRAGNFFPYFILFLIPAWIIQALLAHKAAQPGLRTLLLYSNAFLFLIVGCLLLGGLLDRISRSSKELKDLAVAPKPQPAAESELPTDKGKKKKGPPTNPALTLAAILWTVPLALLGLEPLAQTTPAAGFISVLARFSEPLLLLNPFRFFWLLITRTLTGIGSGTPINVNAPPALPKLGITLPTDYYQASIIAVSGIMLILLAAFASASRRARKTL